MWVPHQIFCKSLRGKKSLEYHLISFLKHKIALTYISSFLTRIAILKFIRAPNICYSPAITSATYCIDSLSNIVEKYSVCLSVRGLTLVNILQMLWNLNMLLISGISMDRIENSIYMGLTVRLQRHTNVFWYNSAYGGGGDLKLFLACLFCSKCNKILMWHSDTQKQFLFLFLI